MQDRPDLIYGYDGTFDGFLTTVFKAYRRHEAPGSIAPERALQLCFGRELLPVRTNPAQAERVARGLVRMAGEEAYRLIFWSFCAEEPDRDVKLFRLIRLLTAHGRRALSMAAHPDVLAVRRMYTQVANEWDRWRGFVRFSELAGGVYYARFAPLHHQLPLLTPHFADRFAGQPFLLHDTRRALAAVYDTREWYLAPAPELRLPSPAEGEQAFRRMWKRFYDAVAIRERNNPRCRLSHMPRRYWRDLTELDRRSESLRSEDGRGEPIERAAPHASPAELRGAGERISGDPSQK